MAGNDDCEGETPVQSTSSADVNMEEALVGYCSEAVDSVLVARARSVPWAN